MESFRMYIAMAKMTIPFGSKYPGNSISVFTLLSSVVATSSQSLGRLSNIDLRKQGKPICKANLTAHRVTYTVQVFTDFVSDFQSFHKVDIFILVVV